MSKNNLNNIAFQGQSGAYSELACTEVFPEMQTVPCENFEDAFEAVINGTTNYGQNTTGTSATDVLSSSGTVWETAITPSATNSNILIQASICIYNAGTSGTVQEARFNLRAFTKIGSGNYSSLLAQEGFGHYYYNGAQRATLAPNTLTFSKLSNFNTTSAITFKFTYDLVSSGATIEVNAGQKISSLTLFEIAG